ncbi:phosphatase PAP2 family protein [Massilia varians]|uniref:phosphatase PAP2 family protein n=1 Tax=Massilia varians TaxID=457921 RepID=UPI002555C8E0|nr:phosphatase PAP2 family protein [Massilia varians]MDK6077831.1 phosphatase PAP2 family protein [Massilia varians]
MPASAIEGAAEQHAGALLEMRSCRRLAAALVLMAPLLAALGQWTDVDLVLADWLYSRASAGFPWRDAWLTATFGHEILKAGLALLAACFVALAIIDAFRPQAPLDRPLARLRLRVIACSAVLVPLATSLLKQASSAHCPWDLARYGGNEPYVRLFEALPAGILPGHCMPAGHASSALWLVSLVVLWLPGPGRGAWRAACLALAPGLVLGWMQQMRGAHFLTHTLWSAWIACAIVLALVMLLQPSGGTVRRAPAGTRCRAR